jgi:hypothetical protein
MKDLTEALLEFGEVPEKVVRGTLLGLTNRIVKRSPVDTGRFRNNWQASTGTPATGRVQGTDKTGNKAVDAARTQVNKLEMGQDFYLSNNLPYAHRLEFGWSKQAPSGMLRLSIAELQQRMNEAGK